MLETQKYLHINGLDNLLDEFGIIAKIYPDRVVLNYRIDSKPKFHPIVKECRGLILSLPYYDVLCRSFDRFFNYGEGDDKDIFDWSNAIIFDKLDGSLINVHHDGLKWCAATRGTAFAEGSTLMGKSFYQLFAEAIGDDLEHAFQDHYRFNTYIFELTSPENRVVTRYSDTKATLLAVRNNVTGDFLDYSILKQEVLYQPFTTLAKSYKLSSPEDVIEFVESRDAMDEGCVCYDITNQLRIKIKNSSYVAIHHLRGNEVTEKSIITLLLNGEVDEYLNYFKEDTYLLQPYINRFNKLMDDVTESFKQYNDIGDQKTFALMVQHLPYKSFLFSMRKGVDISEIFSIRNINTFLRLLGD